MNAWLIYFILPALYGSSRSLWEPLTVLTELYASPNPFWHLPWNSRCSRDAGISNDDLTQSWCTGCYQVRSIWEYMATMAVAKGMLHNPNQYTDLLMIHWGIHTKSGGNVLEHYLAEMTPVTLSHCYLALVWHNSTFNSCDTTNSSIKEIWANDKTGSYNCTIIMYGGWSYTLRM